MRYYSDKLHKMFDSFEECEKAETSYDEEKANRAAAETAAKEHLDDLYEMYTTTNQAVKIAQGELSEAIKDLSKALNAFTKKYGYTPEKYRSFQLMSFLF